MSDSQNLERLRKEAKLLLKQCRAGYAAAIARVRAQLPGLSKLDPQQLAQQIKLADIHHVLAREHGYPNWAELKRHDTPLDRFLAAVRSGNLRAAQKEASSFSQFAEESIHAACALGDKDAVRFHLDRDPKLTSAEHVGWPPITYACASRFHQVSPRHGAGILHCTTLLLDRGADPNTSTLADPSDPQSAVSALARAHFSFNVQVSALLRERGAGELTARGTPEALRTLVPGIPLDEALCRPEFKDLLEETRKRLAPFKHRLSVQPVGGLLLTDADFRTTITELAELHVQRGIDPNLACNSEGSTLLHEFAWVKNHATAKEVIEWLLRHGADPNLPQNDGQTPFVLAVRSGNTVAAEVMLAHGADINSVRPLDELTGACRNRDATQAREILRRHPDTLTTMGAEGHELLVSAAAANRQADVRFMAELGFDLGGLGENGATALHVAAFHGQREMVQLLLELRAPVNIRDATFGTSPLAWAAQGSRSAKNADDDYCEIVEALLDAGSDYATCLNRWGVGPEAISTDAVAALLRARGFSR